MGNRALHCTEAGAFAIAAVSCFVIHGAELELASFSPGDDVVVGEGDALAVADVGMAAVNAFNSFTVESGGVVTFNLADDADLACVFTNRGTVVKKGAGALKLANQGMRATMKDGALEIEEGALWCPQDYAASVDFNLGKVTVASNGTFVTAKSLASDSACNTIIGGGLWGDGVVTNVSTQGGCQLRVQNVGLEPCVFGGRIAGRGIRWYSGGNVRLTGTNSNFSGTMQLWSGYNQFDRRGVTGLVKIGNKNEASSAGLNGSLASREHGACFLYLGEGETTDKDYGYYNNQNNDGMHMWDAGARGGVTFTGNWKHGTASGTRAERLVLTGSNTAPCVVSGSWNGDDSAPTYVIKRGTGTWTLADNSGRMFKGGVAVEEGTLRFTSIAETNVVCSLGLATMLQSSYTGVYDESKNVDYAYLLGTAATRGTMEYAGSSDVDVSTRPVAVKGEGELRLGAEAAGTTFRFSGASALAGGGTLVLSGAEGTFGVLSDAADGAGALGIAKEGKGTWRLCTDAGMSGPVSVKEGTLEVVGAHTNDCRWFKFTIRGNVWSHTGVNDQNSCFAGVRFYGIDGQPLTGTTNMAFVAGTAAGGDKNYGIDDPLTLEPGQYAWLARAGYYKKYTTRDIDRMFGLDTSESRICVAWYEPFITHGYPPSWATVQIRMPDAVGQVAAFDVRPNYPPTNGRALADWTLYASEDGRVWDEVARYDWDADTMPASGRWFSDGTDDKDVARPGKGYPVLVSFSNDPFANVSAVSVASNATLKAVGRVALGRIAVDASGAGNGTLDGFTLDESGSIFVTGAGSLADSLLVPVAFANCTGLENVSKWQVCVGGAPTARWRVKATQSGLKFFSTGTQVLIR